jgi:hypothetical protein
MPDKLKKYLESIEWSKVSDKTTDLIINYLKMFKEYLPIKKD